MNVLKMLTFQRIEILKEQYEHVDDIDLIVGIWAEKAIKGGFVPPTFYCLVVEQLIRNMVSDRHWYERQNRPHAFTMGKFTIEGIMRNLLISNLKFIA